MLTTLEIRRMREKIRNPKGLAKECARIIADECRDSFVKQRLGDIVWENLYPGQRFPFISIAGALEDFINGRGAPQEKRFDNEPSLATGIRKELQASIKSEAPDATTAGVWSDHKFAASTQDGSKKGDYVVSIPQSAKDAIRLWLFKKNGRPRDDKKGYVSKLAPLLNRDEYTQAGLPRQFIGITDYAAQRVRNEISVYFERILTGGRSFD